MGRRKKQPQTGLIANEENVKKVTVWGSSRVLSDKMEVDYYKAYIKEITLLNKLIGSVSDAGNYNLKDRTKRDLVKMDKEIADYSSTYIVAMASFMGKVFNFAVEIEILDDGMASASLYLNEAVNYYPPIERLHSFVAKVVLAYDGGFYDKLCKTFNLYETTINIQDTDIPYLAVTMQEMSDQLLMFDEVSDLGSQIYLMRMLKTLTSGGKLGEEIVEEYKKQAEELNLDENKQGTYSVLHRKLDEIIEAKGGLEKLPIPKEEAEKPRQEYNETIRKLDIAAAKKTAALVKQREKDAKKQAKQDNGETQTNKPKAAVKTAGKSSSDKTKKPTKAKAAGGDKKNTKTPTKETKKKEESITVRLGKTEFESKKEDERIDVVYSDKNAPKAEVPPVRDGGAERPTSHDAEINEEVVDELDNLIGQGVEEHLETLTLDGKSENNTLEASNLEKDSDTAENIGEEISFE